MRQILQKIIPPPGWQLPVIILLGIIVGLGLYIMRISNAPSYLSNKSETCINCHVMNPQYATWNHSSHREVATCVDCHVPHDNIFNTYYFKGKDGLRHAKVFTMRAEPQVIFIKEEGKHVVQQNCVRCHEKLIADNPVIANFETSVHFRTERSCIECHRETPHGRVNSLSSVPDARVPKLGSVIPKWLSRSQNKK
jgi:cytochrome c nitrite reductase small subunit